jgi:hypothetical protein
MTSRGRAGGTYPDAVNDSLEPGGDDVQITLTEVDTAAEPVTLKRRKAPIFFASAVAVALVLGVAAYAANSFLFGGAQPAERMPASAMAYLSIDVHPGLDQTRKLAQLSKKLPQTGGSESPKAGLEKVFQTEPNLKGIDYQRDVAPWLGNRVAIAAWADTHQQVYGLLAVQSTDDKTATAALTRITDALKGEFGFTIRNGYALAAFGAKDAQAAAEAAAAEAAATPLSQSAKYAGARDWLNGDQFAVVYADFDAYSKMVKSELDKESSDEDMPSELKLNVLKDLPSGTMVVGVQAVDDGLAARYKTFGAKATPAAAPADALAKLGALPAGTAMGAVTRLPENAMASPILSGLSFLLPGGLIGGDDASMGVPRSPLTPDEESEFAALSEKQMNGKLTKAEQKRYAELKQKMISALMPPGLTKAEQAELQRLMAKENPTDADQARMDELFGVNDIGSYSDNSMEKAFGALSGGLLNVAVTPSGTSSLFRMIVELAKTPEAGTADRMATLFGPGVSAKLDGSTLTVQSTGFSATGRLADDPLYRKASTGASADAQMAVYVDLARAYPQAQTEIGSLRALFISGGSESGTAKVLIG